MENRASHEEAAKLFFQLLNTSYTLQDVVNQGAALLGAPLSYCDSAYRPRAVSGNYPQEDIDARISYRTKTSPEELYRQMLVKTEFATNNTPFVMQLPGMCDRWISKAYYAGCNTGHVAVPDCQNPRFQELDLEMLRIISDACALAWILLESKSRFDRDYAPESAVFERIFKEEYDNEDTYRFQMSRFSFDQYHAFCCLAVSTAEESLQIIIQKLCQKALRLGLCPWTTVYRNRIVCMLGANSEDEIAKGLPMLDAYARKHALRIAASDFYTNILHTRRRYTAAERLLAMMERKKRDGLLTLDSQKAFLYLADTAPALHAPEDYCHSAALSMLRYDRENNKEYAKTLRACIRCDMNQQLAADSLFVHKNTVQYRLARIRELFGIDPANPSTMYQMRFSFELLDALEWRKEEFGVSETKTDL